MPEFSSGLVVVSSGVTSTGIIVVQTARMDVQNGGQAIEAGASGGGAIVVSGGGTLKVCTVSPGGTVTVLENGYASDVAVAGGLYIVSSGGFATKSEVQPAGSARSSRAELSARTAFGDYKEVVQDVSRPQDKSYRGGRDGAKRLVGGCGQSFS